MKHPFTFLLILLSCSSFGQLNIDSLYSYISTSAPIGVTPHDEYVEEIFYVATDSMYYQFTVDLNGLPAESIWGVSLITQKVDSLDRTLEERMYRKDGQLFGGDGSPIVRITYEDEKRLERFDYFSADNSFVSRIEICSDEKGREISMTNYDTGYKMISRQTTDYLDEENATLKKFYNAEGQLTENDCGVSVWYVRTDQATGIELERKYLDRELQPVDCAHDEPELVFAYFIATPMGKGNKWRMTYYTKKGKIVKEFIFQIKNGK